MRVDLFDYELPPGLIAKHPARPRDSARLLDMTGPSLADRTIRDLPSLLRPGDLLVVNDTRVIPSRLHGRRGDAKIEATLHKRLAPGRWAAFARPAKRLRPSDMVDFSGDLSAEVISRDGGEVILDFRLDDETLLSRLHAIGRMPLPPYIKRGAENDRQDDRNDYQTVFAARDGAVAAPTASLRVMESAAREGPLEAFSGETDLFITPGFDFQVIDLLLTNFHLPRSTLLMLVSAIAGRERVLEAYGHAIQSEYRFFSYGDACLMNLSPAGP